MDLTLSLPTLGTNHENMRKVLSTLESQSVRDYHLNVIVPKDFDDLDTVNALIEKFSMDAKIVRQDGYGFENAMNTAFRKSGDININLDDDAIYNPRHIENHLKSLEFSETGIVSGLVNGKAPYMNRSFLLLGLNRLCNPSPLVEKTRKYSSYFNSDGLLTLSPKYMFLGTFRKRTQFMTPIGVNMSWKREAINGFILPEFSKKGTLNESYLSIYANMRGFETIMDRRIDVYHPKATSSLSSSIGRTDDYVKLIEFFISPLVVKKIIQANLPHNAKICRVVKSIPTGTLRKALLEISDTVSKFCDREITDKVLKVAYQRISEQVLKGLSF